MNEQPAAYEPDAPVSTPALLNLLVSMLVAAALLGALAYGVSKLIYLIILFPILMGMGLGAAGRWMIRLYNIRNAKICIPVGIFGGILTALAMHFTGFQELRWMFRDAEWIEPVRELATYTPEERRILTEGELDEAEFQELLNVLRAHDSFGAYLDFHARAGVEISNVGSGSGGLNLGFIGTWIYWIVECGIIAFVCIGSLKEQARAPFCEKTMLWMTPLHTFQFDVSQLERVKRCLLSGDPQPLKALPPAQGPGFALVTWFQSPLREESDADIAMVHTHIPSGKKDVKSKWDSSVLIPKAIADRFLETLSPPPEEA